MYCLEFSIIVFKLAHKTTDTVRLYNEQSLGTITRKKFKTHTKTTFQTNIKILEEHAETLKEFFGGMTQAKIAKTNEEIYHNNSEN